MIRVGIIGFGFMGRIHLRSYLAAGGAEVAAVADPRDDALARETPAGPIATRSGEPFDISALRRLTDYRDLLNDPSIDAVSICSPTREHVEITITALEAGKHVLVEKPLGMTAAEAMDAVEAAERRPELVTMPAMCMRFWPAWRWLREAIATRRYGAVMSASFTRLGSMPKWASFYSDARESGGAILDLHIHDADFVRACFGDPYGVRSFGYSKTTREVDHVVTIYDFSDPPPIVSAEGGWCLSPGFPFAMRYLVNFERATASFDLHRTPQLLVNRADEVVEEVTLDTFDGWEGEVRYFLECIENRKQPELVSMRDGAAAIKLIETERESVRQNRPVQFATGGS